MNWYGVQLGLKLRQQYMELCFTSMLYVCFCLDAGACSGKRERAADVEPRHAVKRACYAAHSAPALVEGQALESEARARASPARRRLSPPPARSSPALHGLPCLLVHAKPVSTCACAKGSTLIMAGTEEQQAVRDALP